MRIALISLNQIGPSVSNGGPLAMLEIMLFLKKLGNEVSVFHFVPADSPRSYNRKAVNGIMLHEVILPFKTKELHAQARVTQRMIMRELAKHTIDYAFTLDDAFEILFSAYLLRIPAGHFIHSVSSLWPFNGSHFYAELLRKTTVFVPSLFMQNEIKSKFNVNPIIWPPLMDINKYVVRMHYGSKRGIGFYYSGQGKGLGIFRIIVNKLPNFEFYMVGKDYGFQTEPLPVNLRYLGHLDDMCEFYESIKVLLVPSTGPETFSRVILEAAVNGIPVIANNVGALSETMGKNGILIDLFWDGIKRTNEEIAEQYVIHIEQILSDEKTYCVFQRKARMRAREYDANQNKRCLEIYHNYINRRRFA